MNTIATIPLLNSMTRNELRSVAKVLGIPQGKNKADTKNYIHRAICDGKALVKYVAYLMVPPDPGFTHSRTIFMKKLRTYKEDKTLMVSVPVSVSTEESIPIPIK